MGLWRALSGAIALMATLIATSVGCPAPLSDVADFQEIEAQNLAYFRGHAPVRGSFDRHPGTCAWPAWREVHPEGTERRFPGAILADTSFLTATHPALTLEGPVVSIVDSLPFADEGDYIGAIAPWAGTDITCDGVDVAPKFVLSWLYAGGDPDFFEKASAQTDELGLVPQSDEDISVIVDGPQHPPEVLP
jgi:hypothetical protein